MGCEWYRPRDVPPRARVPLPPASCRPTLVWPSASTAVRRVGQPEHRLTPHQSLVTGALTPRRADPAAFRAERWREQCPAEPLVRASDQSWALRCPTLLVLRAACPCQQRWLMTRPPLLHKQLVISRTQSRVSLHQATGRCSLQGCTVADQTLPGYHGHGRMLRQAKTMSSLLHFQSSLQPSSRQQPFSAPAVRSRVALPRRGCACPLCLGWPPPMRGNSSELRSRSVPFAVPSALMYWACGPLRLINKPSHSPTARRLPVGLHTAACPVQSRAADRA